LAHEGRNWKITAIFRRAPHELVVVAKTGVPPAANEIIDIDLDDFPELFRKVTRIMSAVN
jgi:hypothetical protein